MKHNTSFLFVHALILLIFSVSCSIQEETNNDLENKQKQNISSLSERGIVFPENFQSIGDTLRVLSWNVEHFVDMHNSPYIDHPRENNPDTVLLKERVQLLIEAIRKVDADVVVLQEFENGSYLQQLAKQHLDGQGYHYFADAESLGWYMNVVIMSRVPLGVLYSYGNVITPTEYTDEDGQLQFETQNMINTRMWSVEILASEGYQFLLTGVHLKAGRGVRNEAMRTGQIRFLRGQFERFSAENPDVNMLVVGDFNCTPQSEEFQLFLEEGASFQLVDPLDTTIYSHPADAPRWRIDHILASETMKAELVEGSAQIPYLFDTLNQRKVSDHLPIVADFLVKNVK